MKFAVWIQVPAIIHGNESTVSIGAAEPYFKLVCLVVIIEWVVADMIENPDGEQVGPRQ